MPKEYKDSLVRPIKLVWIPGMVDGHPPVRGAEREEAEMIPPCGNGATECGPRFFYTALRSAVVERPLKKCTSFIIKAGGWRRNDQ